MARILIIGAGLAGMSAACEWRATLGTEHAITLLGNGERFSFNPSNPWLAAGGRESDEFMLDAGTCLAKRDIGDVSAAAVALPQMPPPNVTRPRQGKQAYTE